MCSLITIVVYIVIVGEKYKIFKIPDNAMAERKRTKGQTMI